MSGTAAAIGRSVDTYYRDAARCSRMVSLLEGLVPRGGLAFDIGAHLGDRAASFVKLGARVVAVEPQPAMFRALRLLRGTCRDVSLVQAAVGRTAGDATMLLNSANPATSTLCRDFVAAAQTGPSWQGENWDRHVRVSVVTFDDLIARFGVPDFTKLDVEGRENEALAGLSHPLPALSFEATSIRRGVALSCIDRLETLGAYRYNLSLGENHVLRHEDWVSADAIRRDIAGLTHEENSGDVYALRAH
ncbi:FkbM family methyltransferase [Palleronia aestuarii]|uniref:FkbM family methyltransferase n=1 Tax=Palleronia aestuarii TaxID=568105 RepID=UPI001EED03D5|nr:FkbM family methyltransferase [Palleronia aestuarii]